MIITYYGYNSFLVESGDKKIAIDPGGGLYFFGGWLKSIIPILEWEDITHILITHGDPDHYWYADRVAKVSGAPVICNITMMRLVDSKSLLLAPRERGLEFNLELLRVNVVIPGNRINVEGIEIGGIKTVHGPLKIKIGPLRKTISPGIKERIGWGNIGYELKIDNKVVVNLGDTLINTPDWEKIDRPDVLMIPIGGALIHNTMNEDEALEAVRMIKPVLVIPCHYNSPGFIKKNANPANVEYFEKEVKKLGFECAVLNINNSIILRGYH